MLSSDKGHEGHEQDTADRIVLPEPQVREIVFASAMAPNIAIDLWSNSGRGKSREDHCGV
jgi:hypothetical protein